jgi:hypothetical protein
MSGDLGLRLAELGVISTSLGNDININIDRLPPVFCFLMWDPANAWALAGAVDDSITSCSTADVRLCICESGCIASPDGPADSVVSVYIILCGPDFASQ